MKESFGSRLKHAWNVFLSRDRPDFKYEDTGPGYSIRQDRVRYSYGRDRSIVASIYTRIAIDCAALNIQHARMDENGRYLEEIKSGLDYCLQTEANIDQTGRSFKQDIFESLLSEGAVAIVPVDTTLDPESGSYDIKTLRVGKIVQWFPQHVRVELYNEKTGRKEEVTISKSVAAVVDNPLYSVMNESNSTLQRLIRKLSILDVVDEQSGAGKLDLIIQLPYTIKTEARRKQAEQRRKDIENQLAGSKYGIAYTDGTEHVTQLNRSVENNLMSQIEFLTAMLYSQLGMTKEVFEGTADEKTMLNYHNRTIEPITSAVTDAMHRTFLTKTARTQGQKVTFFVEPFKLAPVSSIADIADKLTRNEILSPNEIRQLIGFKPSEDPSSDELRNRNMPAADQPAGLSEDPVQNETEEVAEEEPFDMNTPYSEVVKRLKRMQEGENDEE